MFRPQETGRDAQPSVYSRSTACGMVTTAFQSPFSSRHRRISLIFQIAISESDEILEGLKRGRWHAAPQQEVGHVCSLR